MPYVHLANGDVKKVTEDDLNRQVEMHGSAHAFRENGVEHQIIGVYPEEVEYELSEDEKGANAEREQFEEWKRSRANESEDAE